MITKQNIIIGVCVLGLALIAGVSFLFLQRSKDSTIQYQSDKQFNRDVVSVEESSEIPTESIAEVITQEVKEEIGTQKEAEKKNIVEQEEPVSGFALKNKSVNFGHESASGRTINTIVLHSSYSIEGDPYDVDAVIALWKSYSVAPHYMIARNGTVYQLVNDKNIAYHAGDSKMPDGRNGVNNFSIGVEILNTKTDKYTSAQYQATKDLISYLKKKYGKLEVVGHDTIAPGRKTDPWNFDWSKL